MKKNYCLVGLLFSLLLSACTSEFGNNQSTVNSIKDVIDDWINENDDATVKKVKNEVEEIRDNLNADEKYALYADDILVLKGEGILTDPSELKEWVK